MLADEQGLAALRAAPDGRARYRGPPLRSRQSLGIGERRSTGPAILRGGFNPIGKCRTIVVQPMSSGPPPDGTISIASSRAGQSLRDLHDVLQDPLHRGAGKAIRRLVPPCGYRKRLRHL
jgi:hypothetical protein